MASAALIAWKLAFEISPILLTRGIAQNIPGGVLPIVAITEAANFTDGLLSGGLDIDPDRFWAHFMPVSGSELISQTAATYTFANQAVAANGTIANGLNFSMLMTCPANADRVGFLAKLAATQALKATLDQHINSGGTFSVIQPGNVYTDALLLKLRDVSGQATQQSQYQYVWDFFAPLVSIAQAGSALNTLMQKLQSGTPLSTPAQSVTAAGLPTANPSAIAYALDSAPPGPATIGELTQPFGFPQ